jgi:hypothetical protein
MDQVVEYLQNHFPDVVISVITSELEKKGLTWFSDPKRIWRRLAGEYELSEFGNWSNPKDFRRFLIDATNYLRQAPFYNEATQHVQTQIERTGSKRPSNDPDPTPSPTSEPELRDNRPQAKKRKMAGEMDVTTTESTNDAIVGANIDAMPRVASLDSPNIRRHVRVFKKRYNGYIPTYTDSWATDNKTDWCIVPYLSTDLYINTDEKEWIANNVAQYRIMQVKVRVHHLTALQETTDASNTKQQIVSPATYLEFVHATGDQMPVVAGEPAAFTANNQYQLQSRINLPQLSMASHPILKNTWAQRPPYFEKHPNFTTRCSGEEISITFSPGAKYMTSMDPPNKQRWAFSVGSGVVDTDSIATSLTGLPVYVHHMQQGAENAASMKKQFTWSENSHIGQITPGNWPRYFLVRNHVFLSSDGSVTPCQHNALFDYELTLEYLPIVENAEFYVRKRNAQGAVEVARPKLLNIGPIRQHITLSAPTTDGAKKVNSFNVPACPPASVTPIEFKS